ncbi:MAG: hypothetical protein ABL949_00795 [Fimbriimonadaceae bacterium]
MGSTLLIRHSGVSFQEELKQYPKQPHIILDPGDASHGPAARLWLLRDGKPVASRFFGSIDALRAPHLILAALSDFLKLADDAIVEAPVYRASPLSRQLLTLIAFLVKPDRILVAEGTEISLLGWPIGPETISAPEALPRMVLDAQRKAQWLRLLERTHKHEIPMSNLSIQGCRLGSAVPITQQIDTAGILHAEVCGANLLLVSTGDVDVEVMGRALDIAHAAKAIVVQPEEYKNLLCAFGRENGEEFGMGMIDEIDFEGRMIYARADAVPPVPVRILKLGSLRVDPNGREMPEGRPWHL